MYFTILLEHLATAAPPPSVAENGSISRNDTTQPVDSEGEGRSPTTVRRWLMKKNVCEKTNTLYSFRFHHNNTDSD